MNGKISTPVFLGFTALLFTLSLSGCIIDATPSNNGTCADNRYVRYEWDIQTAGGQSLSCESVGGSTVRLVLGDYAYYDSPCSRYADSTTTGLPEGSYYPTYLQLFNVNNGIVSDTRNFTGSVTVNVDHCVPTDLGLVVFGIQ